LIPKFIFRRREAQKKPSLFFSKSREVKKKMDIFLMNGLVRYAKNAMLGMTSPPLGQR